jgi:hypothetical protein
MEIVSSRSELCWMYHTYRTLYTESGLFNIQKWAFVITRELTIFNRSGAQKHFFPHKMFITGNKIKYILQQNEYQINKYIKQKLNKNNIVTNQNHTKENTHQQNKWITTFTFFRNETQQIVKIFEDIDTRIAFRTINTMQKCLQRKQ